MTGVQTCALPIWCELEVPTLEGTKTIKIPEGTQSHKKFKLKDMGIKSLRGYGIGSEYVTVVLETPTKLSAEQKEMLKQFDDSMKGKNYKKKILK